MLTYSTLTQIKNGSKRQDRKSDPQSMMMLAAPFSNSQAFVMYRTGGRAYMRAPPFSIGDCPSADFKIRR